MGRDKLTIFVDMEMAESDQLLGAPGFPNIHGSDFANGDTHQLENVQNAWDKWSLSWNDEIRQTVLDCLKDLRVTATNENQPSGHKLWKVQHRWNFGHWIIFRCIYPENKLRSMRAILHTRFKNIDLDDLSGHKPGILAIPEGVGK